MGEENLLGIQPDITNWGVYGNTKTVNRSFRLSTHFQQWANLDTCVDLIKSDEARLRSRYSYVLRVRDDSLVVRPFPPLFTPNNTVLTKGCKQWGGFNDKVMLA